MVQTKFYHVRQNNSGGYFIENDDVAINLIVEAKNANEANDKIEEITGNYSEYCPCCGERWQEWFYENDGEETPIVYGEDVKKEDCRSTIIYYLDGRKEKLWYQ